MNFEKYRVSPNQIIDLAAFDCKQDGGLDDDELRQLRKQTWQELEDYQQSLYAESKQSVLVVLQAMDAAGKDSSIARLTSKLNAQSCQVHSFKAPTKPELSHDFLWRVHDKAPAAGEITIFNRSHYEDVLIVKVHGWASEEKITRRYQHINNFEALLADRGTKIIKFMLHISPEYQLERLRRRLRFPEKNWKFNPQDLVERQSWDDYMAAFESVLKHCSSEVAPWYIVPAQDRPFRDLMIGSVILDTLKSMDPQYPKPNFDVNEFDADSIS